MSRTSSKPPFSRGHPRSKSQQSCDTANSAACGESPSDFRRRPDTPGRRFHDLMLHLDRTLLDSMGRAGFAWHPAAGFAIARGCLSLLAMYSRSGDMQQSQEVCRWS